jgi:peptide/nickel transport system substrate-binding protein
LKSGNQNYSELDDPELNSAIDEAAAIPPGPERDAAWEEANRLGTESAVWVPWSWDEETIIHSDDLINPIYVTFHSHVDWVNAGVAQGQ